MFQQITKATCQKIVDDSSLKREEVLKYKVSLMTNVDKNTYLLEVFTDKYDYRYIVKRVPEYRRKAIQFDGRKPLKFENVLLPIFVIEDQHLYLGFEEKRLEGYVLPQKIDFAHVKLLLKALAKYHTENLKNVSERTVYKSEYDDKRSLKLLNALYAVYNPEADLNRFKNVTDKLTYDINKLPKSQMIPSIGRLLENNIYFKYDGNMPIDCKIIKVGSKKYAPLAYDVIRSIFSLTDDEMRQNHLRDIMWYYYDYLKDYVNRLVTRLDFSEVFSARTYQVHVKKLTPFVKLEMAFYYSQAFLPQEYFETNDDDFLISKAIDHFRNDEEYRRLVSESIQSLEEHIQNPLMNREDCYLVMVTKLHTGNYEFLSYELVPKAKRLGLMGDYYTLTINIKVDGKEERHTFFAKFVPRSDELRKTVELGMFKKEDFIYNGLLEMYEKYKIAHLIDFIPQCYFSRMNDVLVLEDETLLNYRIMENFAIPFNENQLRLVVEKLASLHASSLIYEELLTEKRGKVFRIDSAFGDCVEEIFFNKNYDQAWKIQDCSIRGVLDYALDMFSDVCKKGNLDCFKEKAAKCFETIHRKISKSDKYRNVINHGDMWSSNVLFKKDEKGNVIDACLVDFQNIRYCPPSHDLMLLFYVNTDKKTRSEVMDKLIDHYYDTLADILSKFDCNLNDIYTREKLKECCKYMKAPSICLATCYVEVNVCPQKIFKFYEDMKKFYYCMTVDRKEFFDELKDDPVFKSRMRELLEDLYEVCEKNEF